MSAALLALVALQTAAAPARQDRDVEVELRRADGPNSLAELDAYCARLKLVEPRAKVRAVLDRLQAPARLAPDARSREAARAARAAVQAAVNEFLSTRAREAADDLRALVAWMKDALYAPDAEKARLADAAQALLGDEASAFRSELLGLAHSAEEEKKRAPEFRKRRDAAFRALAARLMGAVDACLASGEPGLAFDLYAFLLRADPDNERARRGLGHVRAGDRWLRPFEAEQFRQGVEWDDRLGWILGKARERYAQGEHFDPELKRWASRADLDTLHASPSSPWILRSEHFELHSTANLELSVRVLAQLEGFFLDAFRRYDLFFARGRAALVFGVAPLKKRLRVVFFRDAAQFKEHGKPPFEWAGGFYDGQRRASFFHAAGDDYDRSCLRHELTHQILAEFSDGGRPPAWLAEAAAVFLEEEGPNRRVAQYRATLASGGNDLAMSDILRLQDYPAWGSGDTQAHYRGAGAVMTFLMSFDGGRYRGDTLQMLRDAYAGQPRPLEDYYSLSLGSLDFLMERFYKDGRP